MRRCRTAIVYSWVVTLVLLFLHGTIRSQAQQPDGGGVRTGVLPKAWLLGGPNCIEVPEFQAHEYNEDFYILRQSGCSNYEKPFLFLLFGKEKVLLLDTGAGKTDVANVVNRIIRAWLARNKRAAIQLVVAHTHAHRDHTGGDDQFKSLFGTIVVEPNLNAVQSFFGFKNWPEEVVPYDLGERVLDIIPIPGHEVTSIAIYDRQTAVLFTGDTLYPGRLYVKDANQFVRSIQRLADFTQKKIVAHILGNHIENTRTPYLDYKIGTVYQPDEHALELGRGDLLELNDALHQMNGKVVRMAMRDFTIWPM
jgi:glyoxylase-like metal-dependent hydrolase (beta-lactamase superfamily II)